MRNFAGGRGLFSELMGIWASLKPSKLKATVCKYWTLIKIKEYEGKMKIVQQQWLQLKMKLFLAYNMKMVI